MNFASETRSKRGGGKKNWNNVDGIIIGRKRSYEMEALDWSFENSAKVFKARATFEVFNNA